MAHLIARKRPSAKCGSTTTCSAHSSFEIRRSTRAQLEDGGSQIVAGSYNHIVLVGRLVADPELRQTQEGTPVTSFRIAVNRPKGRSGQEQTDFFGVSVWRQRAEAAAKYLQKGRPVLVSGRCQIREYTDREGNK